MKRLTWEGIAVFIVAATLFLSSTSKLLDYSAALTAIKDQQILPVTLQDPALMVHTTIGSVLAVLLTFPVFGTTRKGTLYCVFYYWTASLLYLIVVVVVNGWKGDCGCFPGTVRFTTLHIPLIFDVAILFMIHSTTFGRPVVASFKKLSTSIPVLMLVLLASCSPPNLQYLSTPPDITEYELHHIMDGYSFYKPIGVEIDSPYVFIADQRDGNVAVFDWDLHFMHLIGEKGSGPGEFNFIAGICAWKDSLAVLDPADMRLSIISYDGEYYSSFQIDTRGGWGSVDHIESHGTLLVTTNDPSSNVLAKEVTPQGKQVGGFLGPPPLFRSMSQSRVVGMWDDGLAIGISVHESKITIDGNMKATWDYEQALQEGYPFFDKLLKRQRKFNQDHAGLLLNSFGKGVVVDSLLIMPGPMYNLNVVDLSDGSLMVLNLGELARELSRYGYGTFDDIGVKGTTLLLAAATASALAEIRLADVLDSIGTGTWIPLGTTSK